MSISKPPAITRGWSGAGTLLHLRRCCFDKNAGQCRASAGALRLPLIRLRCAWSAADSHHTVRYTNLPPGRYTFEVEAENSAGTWNRAGASLQLRVASSVRPYSDGVLLLRCVRTADYRRPRLLRLWNVYSFFVIYAKIDGFDPAAAMHGPAGTAWADVWPGQKAIGPWPIAASWTAGSSAN